MGVINLEAMEGGANVHIVTFLLAKATDAIVYAASARNTLTGELCRGQSIKLQCCLKIEYNLLLE
eukprot:m.8861 g.8861  ORF g.8861 m.8861 type:complete len:65 (+) comp3964_c0_seq1:1280-1474(+)